VGYESSVTNIGAALAVQKINFLRIRKIVTKLACKSIPETDQEASDDKHSHGLGSRLESGRDTHNGRTKPDCSTTTHAIGQVGCKWIARQRSNVLNAIINDSKAHS
jgi:hypothetical protein